MLNLETLLQRARDGEPLEYLYFWGHTPAKTGEIRQSCLSQWYLAPFEIDGIVYPTAEHWLMASKARLFGDETSLRQIIEALDPKSVKELGRNVSNFDASAWESKRVELAIEGNLAKFRQHQALRSYLLASEHKILVEASPVDKIWGIGLSANDERAGSPLTWQGLNLLGFALMEVRNQLSRIPQ
ncbi:NADAR family protein [Schlesneria sp. T3-172]|uniref:NADAR family protein n=1 Tax=Schlesneria sphaerica TaxID=3373610 RepID=UPI0037C743D0